MLTISGLGASYAKDKVTFAEFSWESVNIHNWILRYIIESIYDNISVEILQVESAPGQIGITNGDLDIITEIWLSNRLVWFEAENDKTIISAGPVFSTPAKQGWFVPRYISDKIKTIDDVINNMDLFSGNNTGLINAPSGWKSHEITLKRAESYGLFGINIVDPGSGTGLDLAILDNYNHKIPFMTYYWSPTFLMGIVDLVLIEEEPHNPEIWHDDSTYKCSYPPDKVDKLINKRFHDDPKNKPIVDLILKYQISTEDTSLLLAERREMDLPWSMFIKQYMLKNPEKWNYLVSNEDEVNKVISHLEK
jgi:glycine betaine/proline transport system substrate-binding protein